MSKQSLKVNVSNGNGSRIFEVDDQFVKVGRDVKCGVSIQDDTSVSRMHAVIEVTPSGECAVIDLGSGITVNGKAVNKSRLARLFSRSLRAGQRSRSSLPANVRAPR